MPEFDENVRLDTSQIEDRRGRGSIPGGGLTVGGGGIGLLLLLLPALFGGDVLDTGGGTTTYPSAYGELANQSTDGQLPGGTSLAQACQTGADANRREDCRIVGYVNSIQAYWSDEFARRGGRYTPARTQFFSGATQTG